MVGNIKNQEELDNEISRILSYSKTSRLVRGSVKELTHTSHINKSHLEDGRFEILGTIYIIQDVDVIKILNVKKIVNESNAINFNMGGIYREMYNEFMVFVIHTLSKAIVIKEEEVIPKTEAHLNKMIEEVLSLTRSSRINGGGDGITHKLTISNINTSDGKKKYEGEITLLDEEGEILNTTKITKEVDCLDKRTNDVGIPSYFIILLWITFKDCIGNLVDKREV